MHARRWSRGCWATGDGAPATSAECRLSGVTMRHTVCYISRLAQHARYCTTQIFARHTLHRIGAARNLLASFNAGPLRADRHPFASGRQCLAIRRIAGGFRLRGVGWKRQHDFSPWMVHVPDPCYNASNGGTSRHLRRVGFADTADRNWDYAVHKLALAVLATHRLHDWPATMNGILERLITREFFSHSCRASKIARSVLSVAGAKLQAECGGWITDYTADGEPVGLANVETTSLAILAIDAVAKQE